MNMYECPVILHWLYCSGTELLEHCWMPPSTPVSIVISQLSKETPRTSLHVWSEIALVSCDLAYMVCAEVLIINKHIGASILLWNPFTVHLLAKEHQVQPHNTRNKRYKHMIQKQRQQQWLHKHTVASAFHCCWFCTVGKVSCIFLGPPKSRGCFFLDGIICCLHWPRLIDWHQILLFLPGPADNKYI